MTRIWPSAKVRTVRTRVATTLIETATIQEYIDHNLLTHAVSKICFSNNAVGTFEVTLLIQFAESVGYVSKF